MYESVFYTVERVIICSILVSAIIGAIKGTKVYKKYVKGTKVAMAINFLESTVEEVMSIRNHLQDELVDKLGDNTKNTLHNTVKNLTKRHIPNMESLMSDSDIDGIIKSKVNKMKGLQDG